MARPRTTANADGAPDRRLSFVSSPWFFAGLTLVCLLPWLLRHQFGRFDTETDFFGEYGPYARRFLAGEIPADWPYRGPGYHLAVAVIGLVVPDLFVAAKLLSAVAAAAFVGLSAHMARVAAGARAGVVAGVFTLVQPALLLYGWTVGNDMVFSAAALGTLALLQSALRPPAAAGTTAPARRSLPQGAALLLLAGLAGGAALLTRPNGLPLPLIALAALLLLDRSRPVVTRLGRSLLFLGGFLLPQLVWALTYHGAHGRFPRGAGYRNLLEGIHAREIGLSVDVYRRNVEDSITGFGDFLSRYGLEVVRTAIAGIPDHLLRNAREVHGPALALLAVVGLLLLIRSRPRDPAWWLLPIAAVLFASLNLLTIYAARLSIFLCAPVAWLGAMAFVDPASRRWRAWARSTPFLIVVAGAAVIAGLSLVQGVRANQAMLAMEATTRGEFQAGVVLAARAESPGGVAARKPHVAWAARRAHRGIPDAPLGALADSLRGRGVAFLYYGPTEMEFHPQYLSLTSPAGIPPGLRVVWVDPGMPPRLLFQVLPAGDVASGVPDDLRASLAQVSELLDRTGLRTRFGQRLANDLFIRGQLQLQQGKFREALAAFRDARPLAPESAELLYLLGCAAAQSGEWREGYDAVVAAEGRGARSDELDYIVALAALGLGRLDEAETRLAAFLGRNPRHPLGRFLEAQLRLAQGRNSAAREAIDQARAAGFSDAEQLRQLESQLAAGATPGR